MTASATPTSSSVNSVLDEYSRFVNRLAANTPHPSVVPARMMRAALMDALQGARFLDQVKKGFWYGRDTDGLQARRTAFALAADLVPDLSYDHVDLRLLHAIIGIHTEASELLSRALDHMVRRGEPLTKSELVDEGGDLLWYTQLLANAVGSSLIGMIASNQAKLRARFPDGFDEDRAASPNKAAEAAAQARPRDARQAEVAAWIADRMSPENASNLVERGRRLAEEGIEAGQAVEVSREEMHRIVDMVYDKPPGEPGQEAGGVSTTLLAYCAALRISADEAEERELERMRGLSREHMQERHARKVAAGTATA